MQVYSNKGGEKNMNEFIAICEKIKQRADTITKDLKQAKDNLQKILNK